jgi:hypothetical protein
MIGTEVQTAVKSYVKVSLSDSDAIVAINEAIDLIASKGYLFGDVEVAAASNTWYEMPAECTSIVEVRDGDDEIYYGWRQKGTLQIKFADAGAYTITARRLADHITTLTVTLPVHLAFHQAIATYCKAWKKAQINDESVDANNKLQLFFSQIETAYREISRRKSTQWKVIRHA